MQGRINTLVARATPATANPATATPPHPPGNNHRFRVLRIQGSLKGTVTPTSLQLLGDDATVLWDVDVSAAGPFDFSLADALGGLSIPRNEAQANPGLFSVVLGSGGAAVVGKVNVIYALEF